MRLLLIAAATLAAVATAPAPAAAADLPTAQRVVLTIRPALHTSLTHPSMRANGSQTAPDERVSGSNFAVRPGLPVRVVVWNYTRRLHTFDSPGLGVNVPVLPGSPMKPSKTVFTFVARTYGRIPWSCRVPCGGHMGGNVYAIID